MDVALVGVVVPGAENHSLAALGTALAAAGYRHRVVPFGGFPDMDRVIDAVIALRPRVCGVSLQTTESALATLAFTRLLRQRGYDGTIVVGGHVASVAADDILAAPAGVDVVVELAGEDAIVGLARGDDPRDLVGTVTRSGRGLPARAVQPRAVRRERLSDHLGFGAADLLLSRGCAARCGYCCVAAVSAKAEASGDSRHIALDVRDVADEIRAAVDAGGRAFHIMDDNLLPLDPGAALEWARALRDALGRLPPIAFSLQLRADVVTPELAGVLAELGLVRAYVGIDGYSAPQLRAIGRCAPASAGNAALAELSARGIACVANALLVGPTLRLETIADEVEALATVQHAPVHLLPIEARPGTPYHRRAAARGLIEGGLLWPVYRFVDERAFRVAEVITGLPTRLAERSVPIALYDLAWAMGVARRLVPEADVARAIATYAAVTQAWNADQVRVLRAAIDAARHGSTTALLAREQPIVRAHDEILLRRCDAALRDVERAVSAARHRPVRAHARGRLLGELAIAMGLASACGSNARTPPPDATLDAGVDAASCADSDRTPKDGFTSEETCSCATTGFVQVTFDADGEVTGITDANGQPLPPDVEQCFLDLVAMYCYPSLAGMTSTFMTCHSWIA